MLSELVAVCSHQEVEKPCQCSTIYHLACHAHDIYSNLLVALDETPTSSSKSTDPPLLPILSEHTATPLSSITTAQVFMAKIILLLLSALPNKVDQASLKEALRSHPWASVGIEGSARADAGTKVLYTCVGKKLIVIERREGMVRFAP